MRIVKEFIDNVPREHWIYGQGIVYYGLGDDGNLYIKWTFPNKPQEKQYEHWQLPQNTDTLPWPDFQMMKRLLKEFGHLLVFI
jgi:hypothetical protein